MTEQKKKLFLLLLGLVGVLLLTLTASYLYFAGSDEEKAPQTANYEVESSGEQENIDFTDKCKEAHAIVDAVVSAQKAKLLDVQGERKSISRRQKKGDFIWDVRSLDVQVSAGQIEAFAAELEQRLQKINAKILDRAKDRRNERRVLRFDVGLTDEIDKDTVTIITDKLYVPDTTEEKAPAVQGKLAFVIDDFGYNKAAIHTFRLVKLPLTFAVLPNLPHSREAAETGYKDGRKILLHLPMEAESSGVTEEKQVIRSSMSDEQIQKSLYEMLAAVPHVIGVNNHQGSQATADPRVMRLLLSVLNERGYFFIDSRTSGRSIAYDTARQMGVLTGENRLFIDNKNDLNAIKEKIREAAEIAKRDKTAIVIGHARPYTAEALSQMTDELERMGVEVVFTTEILN